MIKERDLSTIRPGMLIKEKRIAFIRREAHNPPNTCRFMIMFKFIAKIMIHHQAAFSPKSPDGSLRSVVNSGHQIFHAASRFS